MTAPITDRAKPLALQAILYFAMARAEGKPLSEAVTGFLETGLCWAFGEGLTVGNVWGLAEAAGYCDPVLAERALAYPEWLLERIAKIEDSCNSAEKP